MIITIKIKLNIDLKCYIICVMDPYVYIYFNWITPTDINKHFRDIFASKDKESL